MDSKLPDQKDIQTTMPEVDVQATWRKHGWTPPSERIKPIPEKKESIPSIPLQENKMSKKKELSPLARQLLGNSGAVRFYLQHEFDDALTIAKAEIMTVAIQTSKQAIYIERQACAEIVRNLADSEDEGELATALKNASEAILNRIPSQRQ